MRFVQAGADMRLTRLSPKTLGDSVLFFSSLFCLALSNRLNQMMAVHRVALSTV